MDPRHPETAITRVDELVDQFKRTLADIRTCKMSSRLGTLEREGSLVIQELCLVAPRLHEAMMQVSRTRRGAIVAGFVVDDEPKEEPKEEYVAPNQAETVIVEPKPRKKKTSKKKKAE